MPDKVVVTKSKLDDLAVMVAAKSGEGLPLTVDGMTEAVKSINTLYQEKTVTPTEGTQVVVPDEPDTISTGDFSQSGVPTYNTPTTTGYYTFPMDLSAIEAGKSYHVTGSGHYTSSGLLQRDYTVDDDWIAGDPIPTTLQTVSITWSPSGLTVTMPTEHRQPDLNIRFSGNLSFVAKEGGYAALSKVTVNPIPSSYIASGTLDITENGTDINVAKYEKVNVSVLPQSGTMYLMMNGDWDTEPTLDVFDYEKVSVNGSPVGDGCSRIWIEKADPDNLYVSLMFHSMGSRQDYIDWGDGAKEYSLYSGDRSFSHTYASTGKYCISIGPTNGSTYYPYFYVFTKALQLEILAAEFNDVELQNCSLYHEDGCPIKRVSIYSWDETISRSIEVQKFRNCKNLKRITIPSNIVAIEDASFQGASSLSEIHFKSTTPPQLSTLNNVFDGLPSDFVAYVPYSADHSVLQAYQQASTWAKYVSHLAEEPES